MSAFRSINLTAILLCFAVVVFGAYVRLSDAGLGCPDWPGCYGHIGIPQAAQDIAAAESKFPERPVEAPKAWKEMGHRYLAATLGLLIVVMALLSMLGRQPDMPRRLTWLLLGLVMFQGVLGMWTVTLLLKPLVVTGHLLGGLSTLCLLLWIWLRTRPATPGPGAPLRELRSERATALALGQSLPRPVPAAVPPGVRGLAMAALILVCAQVFLGGWTSTNYAALACPDFPTCHGRWIPETDLAEAFTLWRGLGINYEYGVLDNRARVSIHFFHRVGAVVVSLFVGLLGVLLILRGHTRFWRGFGVAVLAALTLQVVIGISTVMLQLPLALAAAHNAGAAFLLMTLVSLNFFLRSPRHP